MRNRLPQALLAALLWGCASTPTPPAHDEATLFGTLRLTPRQGVTLPPRRDDHGYADPRLRDVTLVDYSRPGFAVVYLDRGASPGGAVELNIRSSERSVRLDPELAALGAGGVLRVTNASGSQHVVSLPEAGVLRSLPPGERFEVALAPGAHSIIVLDTIPDAGAEARVFAAPGPLAVVRANGSFELTHLAPGPVVVRTWHPRFPSAEQKLELPAGQAVRLDLEVGVDLIGSGEHADP